MAQKQADGAPAKPVRATSRLRRMAIVASCAWALAVTAFAGYELLSRQVGYFVALSLPVGTVVAGDLATLPDGHQVKLARPLDVRSLPRGAIAWSDAPGTVELQLRTILLAIVLVVPIAAWASLEGLAHVLRWALGDRNVGRARAG